MNKSDAYLDGWLAHLNDVSSERNPYYEASQARSYAQWNAGWCARFSAIKHDLSLTYDDALFSEYAPS